MISINNLTYYIADRKLYDSITFDIKVKDRLALIGMNGTGKSTLLKIIDGQIKPNSGSISKPKDYSIGFLNQDLLSYKTNDSILTVVMEALGEIVSIQKAIEETLEKINITPTDSLLNKLYSLQENFENLGGYEAQSKAEAVLEGIGFNTNDLSRPLNSFSGGWRMRVMLAKLLLQEPSLLMLDEPTNHLDIVSIQWLENYLKNYSKAFIVISHDRNFLDTVSNRTIEIANGTISNYSGSYSFYEREKAIRLDLQQKAYINQQKSIKQTENFIDRFRAKASKAKQVQSRIKQLDKIEKLPSLTDNNTKINFNFKLTAQSGKMVVELNTISKSFDSLQILNTTSATINRGDKIALIGENGRGKSTLLKIITQNENINHGSIDLGHNVNLSFYTQHQLDSLDIEKSIMEELMSSNYDKTETEIRSISGNFMFTKDDIYKKIKVLSGGEKARVALIKLLLSESNFLVLDEPTNHLDIPSIDILSNALKQYQGTFIIVSHDRNFISGVANKIWRIIDNKIKIYPGSYKEYAHDQGIIRQ